MHIQPPKVDWWRRNFCGKQELIKNVYIYFTKTSIENTFLVATIAEWII